MCHIAAYTSALGTVDADILRMVIEIIAEEEGVQLLDSVNDYYGNETRTWKGSSFVSLKTKDLPRGIGIAVVNGKLEFVGDSYGCGAAFNAMKERVESTYTEVVLITAFKMLDYEVDAHRGESLTVIEAVKA